MSGATVLCKPCRERGTRSMASKVVANIPMCDFCLRGDRPPEGTRSRLVPIDKTPFSSAATFGELGKAVIRAKALPLGMAVEYDLRGADGGRASSNAHTYAARSGFAISTKNLGDKLYIMRRAFSRTQMKNAKQVISE